MKKDHSERWRPALRTADKVILGVLGVLVVLIIALSIFQRCGLMPVNGAIVLYLPVLALFVLVGWGIYALVRRIGNHTVKLVVGGVLAMLAVLLLVVVFTYISYMAFYVIPQRYTAVASPSGEHKVLVMRTFDTDEAHTEARKAARLEANPGDDPEEDRIEDLGYVYRAYPQVLGIFYKANADVEGEVYLAIDAIATEEGADVQATDAPHGTLMVEWLDDGATAHFFVDQPGVAEGGDCYVRF